MQSEFIPCGGCGAEHPDDRCIGCMHNFGGKSASQIENLAQEVSEQWSASISKLGMKTVAQVADENSRLRNRWSMLTSELDKSVVETVERVSDENIRLRALLQKAHDEFAKTDHWYHSDIKEELAKELGL